MTHYIEILVETDKLDAIENIDALILTDDGVKIALSIAGYKPHNMTPFERAGALLNMAQELAALADVREYAEDTFLLDYIKECNADNGEEVSGELLWNAFHNELARHKRGETMTE